MFKNISIIGDGAMGTVLANLLCEKGLSVKMWGHDKAQLDKIRSAGENVFFLPGYKLPETLELESRDDFIMKDCDLMISAVPCQFMRGVWSRLKAHVPAGVAIVSVAKGIENTTSLRPDEILQDVLGRNNKCVVFSGPTIADELMKKLPATACVACDDIELAKKVQHVLSDGVGWLRVYTNTDVLGVELAGAMKNVIAIAAGIIDGIGAGDNAKAALLTRGLAEISRLGIALGADEHTFAGLTGLGDLVTTCVSPKGRNRSFGERIGRGQTVEKAKQSTVSVIEGIATCKSVIELAQKHNVEMPITEAVYSILFEGKTVNQAITDLMGRRLKSE